MQVYTDSHVSTKYHWTRPHVLSPESSATITWDIPEGTSAGAILITCIRDLAFWKWPDFSRFSTCALHALPDFWVPKYESGMHIRCCILEFYVYVQACIGCGILGTTSTSLGALRPSQAPQALFRLESQSITAGMAAAIFPTGRGL